MVAFGRDLQLMVPKSFVLLVLHLASILELFLDLHLQRLQRVKREIHVSVLFLLFMLHSDGKTPKN